MDRGSDGAGGRLPPEHGTRTAPGGVAPALLHVRGLGVERAPVQADLLQVRACGVVGVHCRLLLAVLVRYPSAAALDELHRSFHIEMTLLARRSPPAVQRGIA